MLFEQLKQLKIKLFRFFINLKRIDSEITNYERIVKNPYIPSLAYINWGVHFAKVGMIEDAQEKFKSATMMGHKHPDAYINLGLINMQQGNYEEAIRLYIKALKIDKNNAKAFCFWANTLSEMGEYKESNQKFKMALNLEPSNADIYTNQGISLAKQKQYTKAKESFEKACKFNAYNYTSLFLWAVVELEQNELDKAMEKFSIVIQIVPNHHEALYYLAYIYFKKKDYDNSLHFGLRSLELFDKKPETYMLVAENYMNLNNEYKCLKYYDFALSNGAINFYLIISWGISLQHFKYYDKSKEIFFKALEMGEKLNYNVENVLTSLGLAFLQTQNMEEATKYFNQALDKNPKNTIALENLGLIEFENNQFYNAINFFKTAIESNANACHNYLNIANCFYLLDKMNDAIKYYEKAIEYSPKFMKNYYDYINALLAKKDFKTALKKARSAYKLNEIDLEINFLYGLSLLKNDMIDEARTRFEFIKKLSVNFFDKELAKEKYSDYNIKEIL